MRRLLIGLAALTLGPLAGVAAEHRGIRFWNLTSATVTKLHLSPAGTDTWGPDQCAGDRDGEVDHDERLALAGIAPGRYDLKLGYEDGRTCFARDVAIEADKVFSVDDKDLTDCSK